MPASKAWPRTYGQKCVREFAGLRAEMATDRAQVAALSRQMMALLGGFMIGLLGLLAAVVAQL